jgi:hypothetical protein
MQQWMAQANNPPAPPQQDILQWMAPSMITSSHTRPPAIVHLPQPIPLFRSTPLRFTQPVRHATVDGPSKPRDNSLVNWHPAPEQFPTCTLNATTEPVHSSDCTQHSITRFSAHLRDRTATTHASEMTQASHATHGRKTYPQPCVDKKQRPV